MYSESQIAFAVERGLVNFRGFVDEIKASANDEKFIIHVDRLLMNIFLAHKAKRFISKMQACRMIPAEHVATCKKYVEEAEKLGFVRFESDKRDKRRQNVVPTKEFISYVEQQAQEQLDEVRNIFGKSKA